jgi:hypothetical protein
MKALPLWKALEVTDKQVCKVEGRQDNMQSEGYSAAFEIMDDEKLVAFLVN